MMALSLHEFMPIDDALDRGCSLIEEAFGRNFYVEDERGRALTTHRNQRLLRYARQIVGTANCRAAHLPREALFRVGNGPISSRRRTFGGQETAMSWPRGNTGSLISPHRRAL
jgi:hypothetical protein